MIVGIIVSYQPDIEELVIHVNRLIDELDLILIVENGSGAGIQSMIQNRLDHKKIEILIMKENLGLAGAQNKGIARGLEQMADYFLFLDDDSVLKEGSVQLLVHEFETNAKLGIAACHVIHKDSEKIQKYWIKTKYFYKRASFTKGIERFENVNTVISSGSLISRKVIEECGLMKENYFIDYIDIEYCLRIRANDYSITVIRQAELTHRLGNTKSIMVGNMHIHPTHHNPSRRHYMIRNRIWTWKLYAFKFPGWFLIDLGNLIVDNLRVFLLEKKRLQNLKFFLLGIKDGFLKK